MRHPRPAPAVRHQAVVGTALMAIAVLGGCGSDAPDTAAAAPASTTPSQGGPSSTVPPHEAGAETSAPPVPTSEPADAQPVQFTTTMVRSVEVNKQHKGGQANVHVVADVTDADALLDVGHGCVEHYLSEQKAAFCHVWGTEANYGARDPQGVGDLMCWTHYIGVPLSGGDAMVSTSEPYTFQNAGCPDAAA